MKSGRGKGEIWEGRFDQREGKKMKLGIEGGRNASEKQKRRKEQGRKGEKMLEGKEKRQKCYKDEKKKANYGRRV